MQAAKALASLRKCAGSSEPSLLNNVVPKSRVGSFYYVFWGLLVFKGQIQDLGYGVHIAPQLTWICCLGFINLLCIGE